MNVNKAILIGFLGDEVTLHRFKNGNCTGRFPLITNETYTDKKTGEKISSTEWHNIVVQNKAAEICRKHLSKGDCIYVEGRIKTRKWQDDSGTPRYTMELHINEFKLLSSKNKQLQTPDRARKTHRNKMEAIPF